MNAQYFDHRRIADAAGISDAGNADIYNADFYYYWYKLCHLEKEPGGTNP